MELRDWGGHCCDLEDEVYYVDKDGPDTSVFGSPLPVVMELEAELVIVVHVFRIEH